MNPLENKLILQYLSAAGGAMSAGEPVGAAIGEVTQQVLGARSQDVMQKQYIQMLKAMLAGGGKLNLDKDNLSFKAPTSIFGEGGGAKMGEPTGSSGLDLGRYTTGAKQPTRGFDLGDLLNPSASPLGTSVADLAGLTAQDVSRALTGALGVEELRRKKYADIVEETYYGAATRRMEAETRAITPSIEVPGLGMLTRKEAIDWYRIASKDERTAAKKNYQTYVEQETEFYRTPAKDIKSFEDWFMQVARAQGGIPEFVERRKAGKAVDIESRLTGPDYPQTIMEDLKKIDRMAWGTPPQYRSLKDKGYSEKDAIEYGQRAMVIDEYDSRIRAFYEPKGKRVEKRLDGWYVDGELKVRNPYAGS